MQSETFHGINRYRMQEYLFMLSKHWEKEEKVLQRENKLFDNIERIREFSKHPSTRDELLKSLYDLIERIKSDFPTIERDRPNLLAALLHEVKMASLKIDEHHKIKDEPDEIVEEKPKRKKGTKKTTKKKTKKGKKKKVTKKSSKKNHKDNEEELDDIEDELSEMLIEKHRAKIEKLEKHHKKLKSSIITDPAEFGSLREKINLLKN